MTSRRSFLKALSALALPTSAIAGLLRFQPQPEIEIEDLTHESEENCGDEYECGVLEADESGSQMSPFERPAWALIRNHGESPVIVTDGAGLGTKIRPDESVYIFPQGPLFARGIGGSSTLEYTVENVISDYTRAAYPRGRSLSSR